MKSEPQFQEFCELFPRSAGGWVREECLRALFAVCWVIQQKKLCDCRKHQNGIQIMMKKPIDSCLHNNTFMKKYVSLRIPKEMLTRLVQLTRYASIPILVKINQNQ